MKDILFDPAATVQWQVAVLNDGTALGGTQADSKWSCPTSFNSPATLD